MEHKDITGANVHEPKGIEDSIAGQVYVSTVVDENDGPFTGEWRFLKLSDLDVNTSEVSKLVTEAVPSASELRSDIVANTTGRLQSEVTVIGYNKNFQELFLMVDNIDKRLKVVEKNQQELINVLSVVRDSLVEQGLLTEAGNV